MKKALIILVLFFSSALIAKDDDLNGKSIICGYIEENQKIFILGFEFLENNKVEMYNELNSVSEALNTSLFYETSFSLIKIHNDNEPGFLQIDRKTLNITGHEKTGDVEDFINGENCLVYNNEKIGLNMIKLKQKLIVEIKKGNKI